MANALSDAQQTVLRHWRMQTPYLRP